MIICLDLETTGVNNKLDKIIEISMIKFNEETFEEIDSFNCLIDPEIELPELISGITNIYPEDILWAPKIEEIKQEIIDFIWNNPILWHNVDFDINFLIENWINIEKNIKIDTFFLANFLNFKSESLNLEMLCKEYKIHFSWAHRAINDTKATKILLQKMKEKFLNFEEIKKIQLKYIFNLSRDLNVNFMWSFLWFDNLEKLSFSDFEKNILDKVWKFFKKELPKKIFENNIDNVDILKYFDFKEWFEKRENQLKMAKEVFSNLDKNWKIVIEAPTWLWKSFGYLIPSIIYSINTWEKIFVSTNTKTLQDQLFEKDLNFLENNLYLDFYFTKLKWKSNYVSLKWFFDYILLSDLEYSEVSFFSKITLWLMETKFWELDELNYFPNEFSLKSEINSERNYFIKNDYSDYEFLDKARKSIESSNIIIINHSLLFSDLENENSILTNMKNIVIDEAHNIEDTVTDILKKRFNFKNFLESLWKIEKIFTLKNIEKIEFLRFKENIISKLDLIDDFWNSYLNKYVSSEQSYKNILILEDFYQEFDFSDLLKKINLEIVSIMDFFKIQTEYDFSKEILLFENILDVLNIILKKESFWKIKMLSFSENFWLNFEYTVLNPWNYLQENLWKKVDTCILTSATLMVNNSFDYLKNILKLDDFNFLKFESDFDYKSQSTLFIPSDLWNVKNSSNDIGEFLKKFYEIVWWNTLTLFTSFASIKNIYIENNLNLKKQWIELLAQSIWWSKSKILNKFLENPNNTILLWTDSFWEWVDIKWWNLKYLVIYKLPFAVPTDPIYQARSKNFSDPFVYYSIPKAIIKLKQGFWRLIRSKNDKWIVILLDNRINSSWWSAFYSAFPDTINIKKWSSKQFLEILEKKW